MLMMHFQILTYHIRKRGLKVAGKDKSQQKKKAVPKSVNPMLDLDTSVKGFMQGPRIHTPKPSEIVRERINSIYDEGGSAEHPHGNFEVPY